MVGAGTRKVNEDSVLGEGKIKINTETGYKSPDAPSGILPQEFGQQ